MTRTCSLLTQSVWKTISSTGTCVNQSVKSQKHAYCSAHTKWYTPAYTFTAKDTHKGRGSELDGRRRLVFLLRHLLGLRDRWWANQTAWCLCYSPPPIPPCRPSLKPASWHTWQVAPCKCDIAVALENNLCIHYINTSMLQLSRKSKTWIHSNPL